MVVVTAISLVTACGGGTSPIVEPREASDDADAGGAVEGGADAVAVPVDERPCPAWDAPRDYDPPPEAQPEPDRSLTNADVVPDVPLETPDGDGEAAPQAPSAASVSQLEAARDWAESEAADHYAGVWIDDEHGAAVIAFTDDVDRYAVEVRERFGAGWWVVRAEHSEAELQQVQERVIDRMSAGAGGSGTPPGTIVGSALRTDVQRVTVEAVGGDDAVLEELAAELDHPAICFEVLEPPPEYDPDGAVRTLATVPEWRPGLGRAGDGALEIAYDRETAERAYAENVSQSELGPGDGNVAEDGIHAGLGTVDWDREAIVIWSGGRSSSCAEWVEDVRTVDGRLEVTTASPSQGACTSDFSPYRAVLAVDRDRLPAEADLPLPVGERGDVDAVPYPAG